MKFQNRAAKFGAIFVYAAIFFICGNNAVFAQGSTADIVTVATVATRDARESVPNEFFSELPYPGFPVVAFKETAVVVVSGRAYQIQKHIKKQIGNGSFGVVYGARDMQTQDVVAIKLSALSVVTPTVLTDYEVGKLHLTSGSDFANFKKQMKELQSLIKTLGVDGERFVFAPFAMDELILSGQFSNFSELDSQTVRFGVQIMPLGSVSVTKKLEFINLQEFEIGKETEVARSRVNLARSVYYSILQEIELLAKIGYGHFDIKPSKIEYSRKTKRFSIIDWEGIRKLSEMNDNLIKRIEGSPPITPPEIGSGKYSAASEVYSLAMTLVVILTPRLSRYIDYSGYPVLDFVKFEDAFNNLDSLLTDVGDTAVRKQLELMAKFIRAAVVPNIDVRRDLLLKLKLPHALRSKLLAEKINSIENQFDVENTKAEAARPNESQSPVERKSEGLPTILKCIQMFR